MTLNDLQRAAMVLFAAREAGPSACVEQMRAICHVARNRVQAGWGDWFELIENAGEFAGNAPGTMAAAKLDINDRRLQQLTREIDGIFYGDQEDDVSRMCARQDKERGPLLYWVFVDRPVRPWFSETIACQPEEHRQRGILGFMYLYE